MAEEIVHGISEPGPSRDEIIFGNLSPVTQATLHRIEGMEALGEDPDALDAELRRAYRHGAPRVVLKTGRAGPPLVIKPALSGCRTETEKC